MQAFTSTPPLPVTSPYALGATLYIPATRPGLSAWVRGERMPELRSVVLCLEDAVLEGELDRALGNLDGLLADIEARGGRTGGPLLFVRPRSSDMARRLAQKPRFQHIDGLVLPKVTVGRLGAWMEAIQGTRLRIMPTLETAEVFDAGAMAELRSALLELAGDRVLALRIGGNDLLAVLGLRRSAELTIYEGPLGYVIGMLVAVMGGAGFALTGPVCERLDDPALLAAEVARDVAHGLVGKTAIHPAQVATIHHGLQVPAAEYDAATQILRDDAAAVFRWDGAMCEPATHRAWARRVLERARWYGVRDPIDALSARPALALPVNGSA